MFSEKLVDLERDYDFLIEIMKSSVSERIVYSFTSFLRENALSVKLYAKLIIALCENVLSMSKEYIQEKWGLDDDISKLIIMLYDETVNQEGYEDKQISEKCLELWDIMFKKQIGQVRDLSRKLMER